MIAVIGYGIFRSTFIGTFEDFLTAFLWGFTVDVGIAKVRELATPLLARVPTPARPPNPAG